MLIESNQDSCNIEEKEKIIYIFVFIILKLLLLLAGQSERSLHLIQISLHFLYFNQRDID